MYIGLLFYLFKKKNSISQSCTCGFTCLLGGRLERPGAWHCGRNALCMAGCVSVAQHAVSFHLAAPIGYFLKKSLDLSAWQQWMHREMNGDSSLPSCPHCWCPPCPTWATEQVSCSPSVKHFGAGGWACISDVLWTSASSYHFCPQNSFPKEVALLIGAYDLNAACFFFLCHFPRSLMLSVTFFPPPDSALIVSPLINVGYVYGSNSPQVLRLEQLCWS